MCIRDSYYIMLIPALLWLFFFSIVPMFGIVMAFQDYNPGPVSYTHLDVYKRQDSDIRDLFAECYSGTFRRLSGCLHLQCEK